MEFIETPRKKTPKKTKGAKKMSEKQLFTVPEKQPRTVRVKTLVIVGALIASHLLAFGAGIKALDAWRGFISETERRGAAQVEATASQLKANQ